MNFRTFIAVLAILFLVPAVLATEASFKEASSACLPSGAATIQFLHSGRLAYVDHLNLFITYDNTGYIPVQGKWKDMSGEEIKFVRSDLNNAGLVFFEAQEKSFTKFGNYTLRLEFPKTADINKIDSIDFQMACPGMPCKASFQCRDDEICANETCISLNCNSCQVGVANRCVARCNDNNPCTLDLCNAGACSYERIKNCCVADKDCDDRKSCTVDSCTDNKCQYPPVQCTASKDPCTRGICSEPVGCEYKTNPLCPLSNKTERKYVVNVGEPEITASHQSLLGRFIDLLSRLFK